MRFSPSALALYDMCPRRWAYKAIARLPEPPRAASDLGTNTHNVIDKYSNRESLAGADPKAVLCAQGALKIVQNDIEKGYQAKVEDSIEFDFEGNTFIGRIDRVTFEPSVTVVRDWKTCKTFNYSLKPEELAENEQSVVYSWAQYERGATFVKNEWVYLSTGTPGKTHLVQCDQPKEDNRRRLVVLNNRADEMKKMKASVAPGDFPANFGACGKFPPDGCPYHVQQGGPCDPFALPKEIVQMSGLADRIKAGKLTPAMLFGGADASSGDNAQPQVSSLVPSEPTVATSTQTVVTPQTAPEQPVVVVEPTVTAAPETITVENVEEKPKRGRKPGSTNKPKEDTGPLECQGDAARAPIGSGLGVNIEIAKDGLVLRCFTPLDRLEEVLSKLRSVV